MRITITSRTSRAVVVAAVAAGVMVGTAAVTGAAAAQSDKDIAKRRCLSFARAGTPPTRPTLAIKRRQTAAYNECMEQAGFGRGHAKTK